MGDGKTTFYQLFAQLSTAPTAEIVEMAFATPLKCMVAMLTDTSLAEQYTAEGKASVPEGGFIMSLGAYQQAFGQAVRGVDPDHWVKLLAQRVKCMLATTTTTNTIIVITDVRMPNEVEAVRGLGGLVVRVTRAAGGGRADGRDTAHYSETALDGYAGWDDVLVNPGDTMDGYRKVVRDWMVSRGFGVRSGLE